MQSQKASSEMRDRTLDSQKVFYETKWFLRVEWKNEKIREPDFIDVPSSGSTVKTQQRWQRRQRK